MKKLAIMGFVFLSASFLSCNKGDNTFLVNALVINFTANDCKCCWGWTIIYRCDTIKSGDLKIADAIGYEITSPIEVYIELGEMEEKCSDQGYNNPDLLIDYYDIIKIEKLNTK